MSSVPALSKVNCGECGRLIGAESHFCQYCGRGLPGEEERIEKERETALRERPEMPVIGGALVFISSIFIFVTISLVLDQRHETQQEWLGSLLSDWPDWFLVILAVFGILGIVGSFAAMTRTSQALAIAGGVLSCFGIGMVIGIVGLTLIAASENEFKSALSDLTEPQEEIDDRVLEKPGFGRRL